MKGNLIKLKKHFEEVIKGKIHTNNPVRNQLIISDAKRNLKELVLKHPELKIENIPTGTQTDIPEKPIKKLNNSKKK